MLSLQAVLLILAILSTGSCNQKNPHDSFGTFYKYGCILHSPNYDVPLPKSHDGLPENLTPKYGDPVEPMTFEKAEEYQEFWKDVQESVQAVKTDPIFYNDMEYLSKLMTKFKTSEAKTMKSFTEKYVPEPEAASPRRDNLGLIMEVFDRLSSIPKWAKVKKSIYFGATELSVDIKRLNQIENTLKSRRTSPIFFERPHVVGVIKIKDPDNQGHIILDMEFNSVAESLMTKRKRINKEGVEQEIEQVAIRNNNSEIFNEEIRYGPIPEDNSYILVHHIHKSEIVSRDIIYVKQPLCSFVRFTNQQIWKSPMRSVVARLGEYKKPNAFIMAELAAFQFKRFGHTFCMGYYDQYADKDDGDLQIDIFEGTIDLVKEDSKTRIFLQRVAERLELTMDKLEQWIKDMEEFKSLYGVNFSQNDATDTPLLRWIEPYIQDRREVVNNNNNNNNQNLVSKIMKKIPCCH